MEPKEGSASRQPALHHYCEPVYAELSNLLVQFPSRREPIQTAYEYSVITKTS